jgi:hypothetical protein
MPKFSAGWLDTFKIKYNIFKKKRHDKAGKVDLQQLELDFTEVRSILQDYSFADIYNMNETAFY